MANLEEKKVNPYDYLNSITRTKHNMMRGSENDELAEELYNKWFVNYGLSMSYDTILVANIMNINHEIPNRAQYEFLLSACPKKKNITWVKKPYADEAVLAIQNYYQCNQKVAREYMKLLTPKQIAEIEKTQFKGGALSIK